MGIDPTQMSRDVDLPKKVGDSFGKFPIISGHFEMETFHLTVMCCCLFVEEQSSKDKNRVWQLDI